VTVAGAGIDRRGQVSSPSPQFNAMSHSSIPPVTVGKIQLSI
jgi:hypothetical protein